MVNQDWRFGTSEKSTSVVTFELLITQTFVFSLDGITYFRRTEKARYPKKVSFFVPKNGVEIPIVWLTYLNCITKEVQDLAPLFLPVKVVSTNSSGLCFHW